MVSAVGFRSQSCKFKFSGEKISCKQMLHITHSRAPRGGIKENSKIIFLISQ